jgi:5-(carboxyamino)imidazole ribonucleotide mutase
MASVQSISPKVALVMGSDSDWSILKPGADLLQEFGVPSEVRVISAHRTPDDTARFARSARTRGIRVIIAGAGGAAHLAGVIASHTPLPVIGVPVPSATLQGLDALLSIVQMPPGVPVATVAIGGGRNAALLALQILGTSDEGLHRKLVDYKARLASDSRAKNKKLRLTA